MSGEGSGAVDGVVGRWRAPLPAVGKASWATRHVPDDLEIDWRPPAAPTVGDLLLCTVESVSLHGRIETRQGVRSRLYPGDRVVLVVGSRYATSVLEGVGAVSGTSVDLLSASGVCGTLLQRSDKTARATRLTVLAQAFVDRRRLNLRAFTLPPAPPPVCEPSWVLVVGSAMDSGKTTACTSLIHGLSASGRRVGAAKLTGTASPRDLSAYLDAGAETAVDFLDCGWPSTAGCSAAELRLTAGTLLAELAAAGVDAGVLEVADGLLQPETVALLADLRTRLRAPTVVLTACESLAAVAGVDRLTALGLRVAAVSGVVTGSPLALREVELAAGVPCIRTSELARHAPALCAEAERAAMGVLSTTA